MGDTATFVTRCGYNVRRDPIGTPGGRVCIDTHAGTWYLEAAIYDTITDAIFDHLVNAWLAGDIQTIEDHVEVARHRHPGLVSLREASDRHERDRAVELAVRALTPVAGAFDFLPGHAIDRRISYADAITELAEHFARYIKNGRL